MDSPFALDALMQAREALGEAAAELTLAALVGERTNPLSRDAMMLASAVESERRAVEATILRYRSHGQ